MVSPTRSTTRLNHLLLGFALLGTLAELAFPFAPVRQPEVRYDWSASDTAVAIPLLPYQPLGRRPDGPQRVIPGCPNETQ
jgi:hypothetical protein